MAELTPGTSEYQEAYAKEMERLESSNQDTKDSKETKEEPKEKEPPKENGVSESDVNARFEKLEKAFKETQTWGHKNAQEVNRLRRELQERDRQAKRPADLTPELEQAIRYVVPEQQRQPENVWLESVVQAIPDAENLLSDPEFFKSAQEKKLELGSEWDNPLSAIRELSELKVNYLKDQAIKTEVPKAIEQARKDFEAKQKKISAMSVPGGSGGSDPEAKVDDVKKIWDMSQADFDKMRSKALKY